MKFLNSILQFFKNVITVALFERRRKEKNSRQGLHYQHDEINMYLLLNPLYSNLAIKQCEPLHSVSGKSTVLLVNYKCA